MRLFLVDNAHQIPDWINVNRLRLPDIQTIQSSRLLVPLIDARVGGIGYLIFEKRLKKHAVTGEFFEIWHYVGVEKHSGAEATK